MKTIEYFLRITKIPHCSKKSEKLKKFLIDFAKRRGYAVTTDQTGNILAKLEKPSICLQAHYDMVCAGEAPDIEVVIKDGVMSAKNSSLGADNGMAVAIMMTLMDERRDCEFLFTADEEIGLIGAKALEFDLNSKYMLNLDSEKDGEVYIGCAGGVDISAVKRYETKSCDDTFYEVEIRNLPGGHSGVDIDKNISNAIKVFSDFFRDKDIGLSYLEAGERINSIAANLKAVVSSSEKLNSEGSVKIYPAGKRFSVIKESEKIVKLLDLFPHGVAEFDKELDIPYISANLALVNVKDGECDIEVSARAMDEIGLKKMEKEIKDLFEEYGFKTDSKERYPAWRPDKNDFSRMVCRKMREVVGRCEFKAIHAGLECAVISDRYPDMEIASIGPDIKFPHSLNEEVSISSVENIYEVVKRVIDEAERV